MKQVWQFNTATLPGSAPAGWASDSQINVNCSSTGPMSLSPCFAGAFSACGEDINAMWLMTESGSEHRRKIVTPSSGTPPYGVGAYSWRIWMPEFETNARIGVGAFLYADDAHEIDFEIGSGGAPGTMPGKDRGDLVNSIPANSPLVFMTVQGETSELFDPTDSSLHIQPCKLYTLTIGLTVAASGNYQIDWFIQERYGPRVHALSHEAAYGPADATFRILCSLENLCFYGNAFPTKPHNAYFESVAHTDGVDLSIRPWWGVVGPGPWPGGRYESPDIFVVNSAGDEIDPKKGTTNKLRARVVNLGNEPAAGANIVFRFAPIFMGLDKNTQTKVIGSVAADFGPFQERIVEVDWLLDETDDNGGVWPKPVGDYSHFCVIVELDHPDDVDITNNRAQNNFVGVDSIAPFVMPFLVANPFDFEATAQLLADVPDGFRAQLRGFPVQFGQDFQLKPHEIKEATVVFSQASRGSKQESFDAISSISLQMGHATIDGFSARLARASKKMAKY